MSSSGMMTKLEAARVQETAFGYRLPATAHVGRVRLAVSNLERSIEFYSGVIGLAILEPADATSRLIRLGAHGERRVLLELEELPGVKAIGKRTRLGLYHTAFLLPGREALSSFVLHLVKHKIDFGSADHEVSEALYLTDPDGLSVEVYADRPRSAWRMKDGLILGGIEPLRFHELPPVPKDSWRGAPAGTTVGHVHFYGDDLGKASAFYREGLGLEQTMGLPSAMFLSAGGYHHHVGVNVWAAGSPVASVEDARLLFWELALPDAQEIDRVAANMSAAEFTEKKTPAGARAFADHLGITVALVVAEA